MLDMPLLTMAAPEALLAQQEGGGLSFLVMMGLIFAIFYFFLIRPQMRQQRERDEMQRQVKKGDRVLTQGGMYGTVTQAYDQDVVLRVDEDKGVKVRVTRSGIAGVVSGDKDAEPPKLEQGTS